MKMNVKQTWRSVAAPFPRAKRKNSGVGLECMLASKRPRRHALGLKSVCQCSAVCGVELGLPGPLMSCTHYDAQAGHLRTAETEEY